MSKKIKLTDEQIKESVARDLDLYKQAGYSTEDYILDTTRVGMSGSYNRGFNFAMIAMGLVSAVAGAVYSIIDNRRYKKNVKQIEDNVNYRINQRQSLNEGVVTCEDLDAQVNVDVNVEV